MAVTAFAAPDADGRDLQGRANLRGEAGRDDFQNHGESTGFLHGHGVVPDDAGLLQGAALHLISAFFADALREHADVGEDRYAGLDQCPDLRCQGRSALQLDPPCAGGQELPCAGHGLRGRPVSSDGQVGDNWGKLGSPGHRTGVADHVLERHGCGVGVAEDNHAERVADQDEVNAGFVDDTGRGIIVSGEGRNFLPALFLLPEAVVEVVHKRRVKSRADP